MPKLSSSEINKCPPITKVKYSQSHRNVPSCSRMISRNCLKDCVNRFWNKIMLNKSMHTYENIIFENLFKKTLQTFVPTQYQLLKEI